MPSNKLYWQKFSALQTRLSTIEKDWLFNKESLTKRLIQLSQNRFSLNVLSEKDQILREDEASMLKISSSQPGFVREVILKGYRQPWVYARSIIYPIFLQSNKQSLQNIGKKPLGSVLFNQTYFKRSVIEVIKYPQELLPYEYCNLNLWARRSIFAGYEQNVLVQEVFLPAFWEAVVKTYSIRGLS